MRHLVVVHGQAQLGAALAMANLQKLQDVIFLGLNPAGDSAIELDGEDPRLAKLADFRLDPTSLGFSSLDLFGEIDALYGEWVLRQNVDARGELMESWYRLPLLLDVGARHLAVIPRLVELFESDRPQAVYMNDSAGYWCELVRALCFKFDVPVKAIVT